MAQFHFQRMFRLYRMDSLKSIPIYDHAHRSGTTVWRGIYSDHCVSVCECIGEFSFVLYFSGTLSQETQYIFRCFRFWIGLREAFTSSSVLTRRIQRYVPPAVVGGAVSR